MWALLQDCCLGLDEQPTGPETHSGRHAFLEELKTRIGVCFLLWFLVFMICLYINLKIYIYIYIIIYHAGVEKSGFQTNPAESCHLTYSHELGYLAFASTFDATNHRYRDTI